MLVRYYYCQYYSLPKIRTLRVDVRRRTVSRLFYICRRRVLLPASRGRRCRLRHRRRSAT